MKRLLKHLSHLLPESKKNRETRKKLGLIIMFNIFKSASELSKDMMEAYYKYYKDKTDCFYDRKINFFKKMMAKSIVRRMVKEWK